MDITVVCRLCGKEDAFLLPIFRQSGKDKQVSQKIKICLPTLQISPVDSLPKAICYKCMFILDMCSEFCSRATSVNSLLRRQYSTAATPCSSDENQLGPPKKRIKTVTADKHGFFPHQSVKSSQWYRMADEVERGSESSVDSLKCRTAKLKHGLGKEVDRSSESSVDSLKCRTAKLNVRAPLTLKHGLGKEVDRSSESSVDSLKGSKSKLNVRTLQKPSSYSAPLFKHAMINKPRNMLSPTDFQASTSYKKDGRKKPKARASSERKVSLSDPSSNCNDSTSPCDRNTYVPTRTTSFIENKKKTPKEKQIANMFESLWMDDPKNLPSSSEEESESDDSKSCSSTHTTMSEKPKKKKNKNKKNKTANPKDQQVPPSKKYVNSTPNATQKKASTWQSVPTSVTSSSTDGRLTPNLSPQWYQGVNPNDS